MRKLITLALMVLVSQLSYSQQYQCVYPGKTSMFSDGTELNAIRLDSVTSEPGCQVFWNYPVIRPSSPDMYDWCFSDHGGSWVGRKFRVYPNGDHVFYNISGEQVLLKTNANLNDSWICYERSNLKVKATIAGFGVESFIGLSDSVKTINLHALDSNGNDISHAINGKQFKISKSNGFVKVVSLYVFPDIMNDYIPDSVKEFTLTGLSSPQAGHQNLTARECYNFDVNDEIHTVFRNIYWGTLDYHRYIESIKKLVSKAFSENQDTLTLTWNVCSRDTWKYGNIDTVNRFYGETHEQVIFSELEDALDKLPGEILLNEGNDWQNYNRTFSGMYGKTGKMLFGGFYPVPGDTCLGMYMIKKGPKTVTYAYPGNSYVEGLGGGYYSYDDFSQSSFQLIYWKKGSEEWGTPYSCSVLLGEEEIEKVPAVSFSPNPVKDQVHIQMASGKIRSLMVFDITGRKIMEKELNQSDYILPAASLEPGIYFVVINNKIRSRIIKQ